MANNGTTVKLGMAEQRAANIFLDAGFHIKAHEKSKAECKQILLAGLGDASVGVLPDGRLVSKSETLFPEATINRKEYTSTTLSIGPHPIAPVELPKALAKRRPHAKA